VDDVVRHRLVKEIIIAYSKADEKRKAEKEAKEKERIAKREQWKKRDEEE